MTERETPTYIFGYGSLIHPACANTTLGRSAAPAPFPTATLAGYARCWTYATDRPADGDPPDATARGVALNLEPEEDASCNGVLIAVSPDELARLDLRETNYDRINVTARIEADQPLPDGAAVYTYVGQPAMRLLPPGAFIPTRYDALVRAGAAMYGDAFAALFDKLTRPHTLPLRDAFYPNDPDR